jgi:hypothetical protein
MVVAVAVGPSSPTDVEEYSLVNYELGDDVWVDFEGKKWPGEVLKREASGYVLCKIHTDPCWDFGSSSARIMPEQTVAVRANSVRRWIKGDNE